VVDVRQRVTGRAPRRDGALLRGRPRTGHATRASAICERAGRGASARRRAWAYGAGASAVGGERRVDACARAIDGGRRALKPAAAASVSLERAGRRAGACGRVRTYGKRRAAVATVSGRTRVEARAGAVERRRAHTPHAACSRRARRVACSGVRGSAHVGARAAVRGLRGIDARAAALERRCAGAASAAVHRASVLVGRSIGALHHVDGDGVAGSGILPRGAGASARAVTGRVATAPDEDGDA
jgi:hypothetical protein